MICFMIDAVWKVSVAVVRITYCNMFPAFYILSFPSFVGDSQSLEVTSRCSKGPLFNHPLEVHRIKSII